MVGFHSEVPVGLYSEAFYSFRFVLRAHGGDPAPGYLYLVPL